MFSNMAPCSLVLVLSTLFFFNSPCFFVPAHAASLSHHLQRTHISGVSNEVDYGVVMSNKRSVLEGSNGDNSSLILAAERTHRKDPLDDWNYYTGGWNISNKHYIASVAYTAAPLFLVAAIWLVGFGLCLLLSCLCWCCCCRGRNYGYSRIAYALSVIFLIFFTIAAIVGAVFLYTGQEKFNDSTTDTLDYVVDQAESTVYNLRNFSAYLAAAKQSGVNQIFLPQDVQSDIDGVNSKIGSAATTLETETKKNEDDILDVLKIVRLVLIIISAVMLFIALLGFLLSVFGLQGCVYMLVIIGWILVTATFVLSGVFLALHNATGDTCVAMDQWVKNPKADTALDDILPCVDTATAEESLSESKEVVFQLIGVVNGIINNITNVNSTLIARSLYNQSGPLVPILCNPFNADRTDRVCVAGEVDFSNATQVWRNYVCQVSQNRCITVGRLTPDLYSQMATVVNVTYALYHYGPFLKDLVDCDFVRDTFTEIYDDHCPGLRKYSRWVGIGLVLVSAAIALSLILWVLYARERRHRKYTKLVDAASHRDSLAVKRP